MAIDVGALARQILEGIEGELRPLGAKALAVARQEAADLAQSLADIAAARAGSGITDDQAKELIAAQMSASAAVLQAEIGLAELDAKAAIKSGLGILGDAALTAIGLGWLAPILRQAIDQL
jgi:hypothetical protein